MLSLRMEKLRVGLNHARKLSRVYYLTIKWWLYGGDWDHSKITAETIVLGFERKVEK